MIIEKITKLFNQLDEDWFNECKHIFAASESYDKERNILLDHNPDGDEIQISLAQYCWDRSLPEDRYRYDPEYEKHIANYRAASFIFSEIISLASKFVNPIPSMEIQYKNIEKIEQVIDDAYHAKIYRKSIEDEYATVLGRTYKELIKGFDREFRHTKDAIEISESYTPKLYFDINQEELAALLYLMNEAGVFRKVKKGESDFVKFCNTHFYFKVNNKEEYSKVKNIRPKISEASPGNILKMLNKLKSRS